MSFTSSMPANAVKLCGAVVGYVFVGSSDVAVAVDWATGIESQLSAIDVHSFHADVVSLLAVSLTSLDRAVAADSVVDSVRCSPLRAPPECTPENFERLAREGRVDEYWRLVERCYVNKRHIENLVECAKLLEMAVRERARELKLW